MPPTLEEQQRQDDRQRAKLRKAQRKETGELITRLRLDRLRRIRDISDEEWQEAIEEDQANAA